MMSADLAWVLAFASAASTPNAEVCASASEAGQHLQKQHRLVEARDRFLACAAEDCPPIVKHDCIGWLSEVEAALPTIVISLRNDEAKDLFDVELRIDGVRRTTRLDGKAFAIDPGPHTFDLLPKGAPSTRETVLIAEGEKNRVLAFTASSAPGDRPIISTGTPPPATREEDRGPSAWTYAVTGLGIVSLAVGSGLGVAALVQDKHLDDTCGAACSEAEVSSLRTKAHIADAALGLAILTLAISAGLWISYAASND
jgi:hypothetical protein